MTQTATVESNGAKTDAFTANFKAATDSFRNAMETGLRFGQDAMKSVSDCFGKNETVNLDETRTRVQETAIESINLIRKNAEQATEMFEANCKAGIEMLKKTFNTFDPNAKNKDAFAQTREMWNATFSAMKSSVDSAAAFNTKMIENLTGFVNNAFAAPKAGR
ncbi:MAG: hypothetical protein HBSAPP02_04040 [Phycisphaerae bacterium]|nr:MAG: hypothetical protein HRU71_11450 [Planctomycetia bacterium]RIK71683.1 MAG: hypothetical protein DCC66_00115 [Planctomycetota bacterium]GJQ25372.1 MAG: hypothetical protein HBSAPP02_04040 [Phycisphaerae bacterium]